MTAHDPVAGDAQSVEIGGERFEVRDLSSTDEDELLRLHLRVFGPGATPAWYEWKYRVGGGIGSGVWHQGRLIAHCGGLPRTLWREGRRLRGLQIGDVLVAPEWRGILTRRGPFFHASHRFYSAHVGARRGHDVAFGFPSERHMRLAVTSKLAWDAGPIHALSWAVQAPSPPLRWPWRWSPLNPDQPDFDAVIDAAWRRMCRHRPDLLLGERSAAYVRWRFLERPGRASSLFSLGRVWAREPVGVAVLDLSGNEALWLDWIGETSAMAAAHRACVAESASRGAASLGAWCSPAVTECLQNTGARHQAVTARLGIPRASELTEDEVARMRWWFMGGDTDFL